MNKEIKFKAWDIENKMMIDWKDVRMMPLYSFEKKDNEGNARDFILIQFTGLLDKNGKEIYEGDVWFINSIEKNSKPEAQIVEYRGIFDYITGYFLGNNSKSIEIVGNIYENPDLLKK